MKILFCDTETTGVNPWSNGIHQLSGIIEIDGVEKESFDFAIKPFLTDKIEIPALKVSNVTTDQIIQYPDPQFVYGAFTGLLGKYVNKFDKTDKFFFCGYNSTFDVNMLQEFFRKNNDMYFGSWFWNPSIDIFQLVNYRISIVDKNRLKVPNMKLKDAAEYLGIDTTEYNLHNALDDIRLTREVYRLISEGFFKGSNV